MSSMTFGQKIFIPTPPDKGSFPLDHAGECKIFMIELLDWFKTSNKPFVVLCCTGSVASIKVPELARTLIKSGFNVVILPTHCAVHFLKSGSAQTYDIDDPEKYASYSMWCSNTGCIDCEIKRKYSDLTFLTECNEWSLWLSKGDPVLHILLRDIASVIVFAPLDANTLAKLANGICDNFPLCVARAWDVYKPFIFCPAMNTHMYNHPLTGQHIGTLKEFGYKCIDAVYKKLACGDTGFGAMAEINTIVSAVQELTPKRFE